jgi:hypothetical protein
MSSGLHARVPRASPCPWVAHPVSGRLDATNRPFGLAFAPAPPVPGLTSPRQITRWLILQKARRHFRRSSDRPEADGFRISFTPLVGVLFTVPSRYWCTIGRLQYLALGRGRPGFPPGSSCLAVLTNELHSPPHRVAYGALTRSGRPFQDRSAAMCARAKGQSPPPNSPFYPNEAAPTGSYAPLVWAPPVSLAATPGILSFPRGTEMFQFPRFPPPPSWCAVLRHDPEGVAPFGHLWITSCQHFPRAFRRVAASFIGCRRQGIHRLPLLADSAARVAAPPSPTRAVTPAESLDATNAVLLCCVLGFSVHVCVLCPDPPGAPAPDGPPRVLPRQTPQVARVSPVPAARGLVARHHGRCRLLVVKVLVSVTLDAPSPGGAAGIRTPDLRHAKAALSRLSYGPAPVGAPGLEPGTSALSGPRSNHLSYAPGVPAPRHRCRSALAVLAPGSRSRPAPR